MTIDTTTAPSGVLSVATDIQSKSRGRPSSDRQSTYRVRCSDEEQRRIRATILRIRLAEYPTERVDSQIIEEALSDYLGRMRSVGG